MRCKKSEERLLMSDHMGPFVLEMTSHLAMETQNKQTHADLVMEDGRLLQHVVEGAKQYHGKRGVAYYLEFPAPDDLHFDMMSLS